MRTVRMLRPDTLGPFRVDTHQQVTNVVETGVFHRGLYCPSTKLMLTFNSIKPRCQQLWTNPPGDEHLPAHAFSLNSTGVRFLRKHRVAFIALAKLGFDESTRGTRYHLMPEAQRHGIKQRCITEDEARIE